MKTYIPLLIAFIALSQVAFSQIDFALEEGVIEDKVAEKIWQGSFAAGLNGKTGNSDNVDVSMNMSLTRKVELLTTKFQASYFYASNATATTTDRFLGLARHEIGFASYPKLSWFTQTTIEDDRFKNYDYLIGLHTGLVYKIWEVGDEFFKLRLGGGASSQVGGIDDEWIPELQLGSDFEKQLSDRTKAIVNVDYFPNAGDFGDYRFTTNAGLEFVVDHELNLNFRIFAINRFDSTPEPGNTQNDLDYGVAIVYGF